MTNSTVILPSDWRRNPGMALRTARIACFEHESLHAMIDICPPENSEGLFDVDSSSWAVAQLYTRHDELEGMQFRDQYEIETESEMPVVVREIADRFYEEFSGGLDVGERDEPEPALTVTDNWEEENKHRTLDEF